MTKRVDELTVRYPGARVSARLWRWCDAHADKVQELDIGPGYSFGDRDRKGYNVLLRPGWSMAGDCCHTLIEPTVAAMLAQLRAVQRCDCEECRAALSLGRRAW